MLPFAHWSIPIILTNVNNNQLSRKWNEYSCSLYLLRHDCCTSSIKSLVVYHVEKKRLMVFSLTWYNTRNHAYLIIITRFTMGICGKYQSFFSLCTRRVSLLVVPIRLLQYLKYMYAHTSRFFRVTTDSLIVTGIPSDRTPANSYLDTDHLSTWMRGYLIQPSTLVALQLTLVYALWCMPI